MQLLQQIIFFLNFRMIINTDTDCCIAVVSHFKTWYLSTVLPKFEVSIQAALVAICHFEQLPRAHESSCFSKLYYGVILKGDNEIPAYSTVSVNQNFDWRNQIFPLGNRNEELIC